MRPIAWIENTARHIYYDARGKTHALESVFFNHGKVQTSYHFPTPTFRARNFRDVGESTATTAAKTVDGRRFKLGMFFRMDAPIEGDLPGLQSRHIAIEFDLRSSLETQLEKLTGNAPSWRGRATTPITTMHFPIDAWAAYELGADDRDRALANMMLTIARTKEPFVVHCSHGADRTGFVTYIMMRVLGFSHAYAMEEYLRTTASAESGDAGRQNMINALADIGKRYASLDGYLRHLHMLVPSFDPQATRIALRGALLS
jgi:hypothetical protein